MLSPFRSVVKGKTHVKIDIRKRSFIDPERMFTPPFCRGVEGLRTSAMGTIIVVDFKGCHQKMPPKDSSIGELPALTDFLDDNSG